MALYKLLSEHDVDFDVVEIFEGVRLIRVCVDEPTDGELEDQYRETQNGQFSKDDFIDLFATKMDYWWDFYDYLDEVQQ
ncbi:MAG: hypothetical protein LW632_11910 [Burkholderiaceae bacterium]|nr:hypothetical protein [Burkholderiaceae bacterium]